MIACVTSFPPLAPPGECLAVLWPEKRFSKQLISAFFSPQARAQGAYLALGSHDSLLIDWLLQEAEAHNVPKSGYEIQMLQGVRRDEQQRLAGLGYQVRIYVPFGDAWYPYFMRRLAERPANLLFIARALFKG